MNERNGWYPFPAFKPAENGDSRHLCVIVEGDFHYVGICSYQAARGGWWQNAGPVQGVVWAFRPLERGYPIPPNSREALEMQCYGNSLSPITDADAVRLAEWWETVRAWDNAPSPPTRATGEYSEASYKAQGFAYPAPRLPHGKREKFST